ncbi:ABC transporter substrate-binding protein [Tumidithrix elongata RA019]|uniref:ABC transporter substrate-binding protein n=1 Tax=Tumidithrix elongata BACA0141 TaxID=2716417 RepID=A0AAW9PV71_9CYAN|nr:ABC transporter substrate-binding protein [Tumidithrix elongata RA019]
MKFLHLELKNLHRKVLRTWQFAKIRQLFRGVMLGILAVVLTSCFTQTSSPLRIGSNLWTGYETLYLARSLGYYEGKPIRLVDYPSGTEEVKAYRNREIEGAGLSIDQAIVLAATQGDVRIVSIMDYSNGGDVILGKPEITNMAALKGKRVGVESTALGAFFIARALEKNGMSSKDVKIVSLELNEHERAYKEGKVDAVVTFGAPVAKLKEAGAKLLFDSSQIPGEILDTLVVRDEAIAKSSDAIQALIDGRFRALDYFMKNPQDAAARIAPRTKVTPVQILEAFKGLQQPNLQENQKLLDKSDPSLINGMQRLIQIMVENKLIPKAIDPKDILEDRFVKNAKL